MHKVMVLGAGTMGTGIAQVLALAGYQVFLRDLEPHLVEKGLLSIDNNLARLVEKGKLSVAQKQEALARITGIVELDKAKDVDCVIEAVAENMEVKKKAFAELDALLPPQTILASNTSGLSITDLATATKRPDKVIGLHFFNPAPVMQLVEVIKGIATSEETYQAACDLVERVGKVPVTVNEAPAFVVNRLLVSMINEAAYLLMEGVATAQEIDTAMRLGANHPMGPLALADLIGLDVCLAVMENLHQEFGEDKYRPCPLLRKMVRAGYLGRKTGRGFHQY